MQELCFQKYPQGNSDDQIGWRITDWGKMSSGPLEEEKMVLGSYGHERGNI